MKAKYLVLLGLVAMTMQSCLHDNDEIFSETAAERINKTVQQHKELLESAGNGWVLQYSAGRDYTGGGYTLLMKFRNGKAYVSSDDTDAESVTSSSYDVIKDNGPVLTFNTYNANLHHLAEVSITNVEGQQGDYEFMIMKAQEDSIVLKGKKYGNVMTMTRVPENVTWKEYLNDIDKMKEEMWYSYKVMNAEDSVASMFLEPDERTAVINNGAATVSVPYFVTAKGVEFAFPVHLGKVDAKKIEWDAEKQQMLIPGCSDERLEFYAAPGWKSYDEFCKNWVIYYNNWAGTLHLKCKKKSATKIEASFTHTDGVTYVFDLTYNKAFGTLSWLAQDMVDASGMFGGLRMMGLYNSNGAQYITWAPKAGMVFAAGSYSMTLQDNGYLGSEGSLSGFVIDGVYSDGSLASVYPVILENLAGGYVYEDNY